MSHFVLPAITLAGQNFDIIKAIKDKMDVNGRECPVSLACGSQASATSWVDSLWKLFVAV